MTAALSLTRSLLAVIYVRASLDRRDGRSVAQQESEAQQDCDERGWQVCQVYRENDRSASRFARKDRPEWSQLLEDMAARRFGVLVLWESSRGDRTPETWFAMLSLARANNVLIHVVSDGRTYDLSVGRDWKTLADEGVNNAYESERTSKRVNRDKRAQASKGMPDGQVTFGYRRNYVWSERHRKYVIDESRPQEPDPSNAPVVREIFRRFTESEPITAIATRLGMTRNRVRHILSNPAYVGVRVYKGQQLPGVWPPIVDEASFYTAQQILGDPARRTTRPGRSKHLLSYLAVCGRCGGPLAVRNVSHRHPVYVCRHSHAAVRTDWLDSYVTAAVVGRLSRPDAYPDVTAATTGGEAAVAHTEALALQAELDAFYDEDGISPAGLAKVEARLLPQIEAARRRARQLSTPPALRPFTPGEDIAHRWEDLTVAACKDVIRTLVGRVALHPMGRRGRPAGLDTSRVELDWRDEHATV